MVWVIATTTFTAVIAVNTIQLRSGIAIYNYYLTAVEEAIQIIGTHLYGEKLHSYGRTIKLEGRALLPSPLSIAYKNSIALRFAYHTDYNATSYHLALYGIVVNSLLHTSLTTELQQSNTIYRL